MSPLMKLKNSVTFIVHNFTKESRAALQWNGGVLYWEHPPLPRASECPCVPQRIPPPNSAPLRKATPRGLIPCRSAPGCPGQCPQAGRLSGLAGCSADRTRMEWNTHGPKCRSQDCAGGRWARPFPSPSAKRTSSEQSRATAVRLSQSEMPRLHTGSVSSDEMGPGQKWWHWWGTDSN